MMTKIKKLLADSGSKGVNISMVNERLESALDWCKKNNIKSNRLKKFDRESKKKQSRGEKRRRFFLKKAKKRL